MEAPVPTSRTWAPMAADRGILPLALDRVCFIANNKLLIDHVSLELGPGVITMLLGPNGAGKSLFLRLCHGLVPPASGAIRWLGPEATQAARHQAMVFQRPVMLRRSVRANLDFALRARNYGRARRRRAVEEMLERADLAALAERSARVLSGGEQQRLALARAWIMRPQVLFLDEPTANLDPAATRRVEDIVGAIHDSGAKIVMTTHDLGQARRLGQDVIFLHQGRVIERAPADRFFEAPQTPQASAYIEGRIP